MEPSCAATAARQLSPWRMPSTPRLDAWIVPRPRRDLPKSRPHHGSQSEALSRQRPGRGRLRPRKNAIIPQNHQIVSISPRAGQGAVAAATGAMGVMPLPRPRPADSPNFSTTQPARRLSRTATSGARYPLRSARYSTQFRNITAPATESSVRTFGLENQLGKIVDERRIAPGQGANPKCLQGDRRCRIEISCGDARIDFLFAGQIPPNVAHIFALQGQRLVLRMTLEENELAGLLPGEDVDAGAFRHRQHLVASCPDLVFVQPVQARVGYLERWRQILGQPAFIVPWNSR